MLLTVKPPTVQGFRKLRRNPHDGVVLVYGGHDEMLRLDLQSVLKLTCVLSCLVGGVNCGLTLRPSQCYFKTIEVSNRGLNSHTYH
jgi:hypothetical protein